MGGPRVQGSGHGNRAPPGVAAGGASGGRRFFVLADIRLHAGEQGGESVVVVMYRVTKFGVGGYIEEQ